MGLVLVGCRNLLCLFFVFCFFVLVCFLFCSLPEAFSYQGCRQPTAIFRRHGTFYGDPVCTNPNQNFTEQSKQIYASLCKPSKPYENPLRAFIDREVDTRGCFELQHVFRHGRRAQRYVWGKGPKVLSGQQGKHIW